MFWRKFISGPFSGFATAFIKLQASGMVSFLIRMHVTTPIAGRKSQKIVTHFTAAHTSRLA
jgi:hypothetical protein